MKTNISKELKEAVESRGQGIVIPMLDPKDLQVKMSAVVHPSYLDAIECDKRWSERFKKQCDDVVEAHKDVLDFEDKDRVEGNKPVVADKPVKIADGKITESLHVYPSLAIDEFETFKRLCDKIGLKTLADVERFMKENGGGKDVVTALKDYLINELGIDFQAEEESLTESLTQSDKDVILDVVKGKYETGHGYLEDKSDYEEALDRKLSDTKYEQLKEFYDELMDLGPEGFYEEYKDKLNFDPDFVSEYGRSEEGEEFEDEVDEFDSYILYCENQFGKYPVCDNWKAMNAEAAVKEFTEFNPQYKRIGVISAEKKLKEALTEAAEEAAEEAVETEPEAVVKIDFEKFKPWGNAVDTYNQIKEAGKVYDFEKMLEDGWPDGIEDATLNGLLAEDRDFISQMIDLEFKDKDSQEGEDK